VRIRHWLRRLEPRVLAELDRPALAWAKPWLDRHELFSFTRRPLARGLAIGLLCGLIPGPLQVAFTLVLCSLLRANVVIGVVTTFYTNPLTIVPLYALAFQIGSAVLPGEQRMPAFDAGVAADGWLRALAEWVSALGWPLVVGLPLMGCWFAMNGYVLFTWWWLRPIVARGRRMRRHAARRVSNASDG